MNSIQHLIEIALKEDIGSGDIRRIVETATWVVSAITDICELKKQKNKRFKKFAKLSQTLSERVEYGIKTDAISLTNIHGIGRKRARILLNHGIRDITKLQELKTSDLTQIPGFGPELAKRILDSVKQTKLTPDVLGKDNEFSSDESSLIFE